MEVCLGKFKDSVIAVSGFKGYIGSSLVKNLSFCEKLKLSNGLQCDCFIHLAASISIDDLMRNIKLDYEICNTLSKKMRVIYASSNNVYPFKKMCLESDKLSNNDDYSLSKIIGESIISSSFKNHVLLRIGDVFGVGLRHGNLFKAIESSLRENKRMTLLGSGEKIRSWIYIKDLVKLLLELSSHSFRGTVNVAYDKPFSVLEVIAYLSSISGMPFNKVQGIADSSIRTMDVSLLKSLGLTFNYDMFSSLINYISEIKNGKKN